MEELILAFFVKNCYSSTLLPLSNFVLKLSEKKPEPFLERVVSDTIAMTIANTVRMVNKISNVVPSTLTGMLLSKLLRKDKGVHTTACSN